jgi:hypothetical protein
MNLPSKQKAIIDYVLQNGSITSKVAYEMLGDFYYHNHEKYIGEILGRLVASGKLVRVKPGYFELGCGVKPSEIENNNQQESLF